MKKTLFILFIFSSPFILNAQQERKFIRQGNKLYEENKFTDAEESYRKALEKKPQSVEANYNVGNVLYKQNKFLDAANKYSSLTNSTTDKTEKSYLYYNLGNSYLQAKKLDESIKSYKESLKLNPNDKETKYNLAYAQKLLMQQQQQQKNKQDNKQNKDNKDKNKQDQQKNQDNKQDNKQDNQKQKQEQSPKNISQEDANRILEAMQNDEKELQKKMKLQKVQQEKGKTLKNW